MIHDSNSSEARRRLLKLIGGGACVLPFAGLVACSGKESAPAATPGPSPSAPPPEPAPQVDAEAATGAPAGPLPRLEETDPTAVALGYRHDVANVDTAKSPTFKAGQACSSCLQYQGAGGDAWGGCGLFPGKLVNADGWCRGFVARV